ncbi:peptidoglycan-binding protein [Sulfitobacter sp. W002]|uniref:peptidoglycan-binding domain-containing protein n=1 Tax=Sulfitobacter sp. W002 TaxID=2867024 RepID=UPI0021A89A70|nr:peptidoglycan-binding domain-containing protein [Sulfitobacter sp. W002]UWR29663.1 peptidoglycan-binding protein [Sulfitobacter sp. W002]
MIAKRSTKGLMGAAIFAVNFGLPHAPAWSQSQTDQVALLEGEISALEEEISASEAAEANYSGGVLKAISTLNTETLRLTQSVLQARKVAEETGAPIEITIPAVQPDPELAESILADLQAQQAIVDTAREEAAGSTGLVAAMAMTRYETERLTLSQLRQSWYRAAYGIAFPMTGEPTSPVVRPDTATEVDIDSNAAAEVSPPAWANSDFPEIDYTAAVFEQLNDEGFDLVGWWGVQRSRAAIDDSPQVFALNVSDWPEGFAMSHPSLQAACIEKEPRVIYNADSYLMTDFNSNTLPVTVRIGDAEARRERWSKLTSSKGAGLFGAEAVRFMVSLMEEEKLFLRLEEKNGKSHDLTVKLEGAASVFKAVADACQVSLLDLGPDDYRAIQALLNAGGYDAGTPDGQWGPGSRAAMLRYQAAEGLEETGTPNESTLERMGVSLGDS